MSSKYHCSIRLAYILNSKLKSSSPSTCQEVFDEHVRCTTPAVMLQPRLRCLPAANEPSLNFLAASLNTLSLCPKHARLAALRPTSFIRHASHAAQGRANGPKDTAGRRLGAKKTATQYVIPGNIIFKQRGKQQYLFQLPTPF